MEKTKRKPGRPAGMIFPRRFMVYDDDKGMRMIDALARKWAQSRAAAARRAIREAAKREGLE